MIRSMNKFLIAGLLVIAVILGGLSLMFGIWVMRSATSSALPMVMVPITESDQWYTVQGQYPQFLHAPEGLNREIQNYVESQLAQFKQNAMDNWNGREATLPADQRQNVPDQPFDFTLIWDPIQLTPQTISMVIHIEDFEGGANERYDLRAFNYDLQNRRDISLGDLFPNQPDYLQKISSLSHDRLLSHFNELGAGQGVVQSMLESGAAPTAANFSNFTFSGDQITVYFQKYQVAPGSFGEQEVTFFKKDISP